MVLMYLWRHQWYSDIYNTVTINWALNWVGACNLHILILGRSYSSDLTINILLHWFCTYYTTGTYSRAETILPKGPCRLALGPVANFWFSTTTVFSQYMVMSCMKGKRQFQGVKVSRDEQNAAILWRDEANVLLWAFLFHSHISLWNVNMAFHIMAYPWTAWYFSTLIW